MNLQQRDDFLVFTAIFLTGLLIIAMALAAWSGLSPMLMVKWNWLDLGIGILAAFGMVVVFSQITSARDEAEAAMGASLAACHWYDLIMLALLVGIIEEVLFRGVLEPWVAMWNPLAAIILVNLLFGALHSLSITYFVVATLLGAILSLLAQGPGEYNLLRPIIAHAVYDYIGFVWLANRYSRKGYIETRQTDATPQQSDLSSPITNQETEQGDK